MDRRINGLIADLQHGRIDRRTFMVRASALGMSAFAAGAALRAAGASAQDASPGASPAASPGASPVASPGASPTAGGDVATSLTPEGLGSPGVEHNTDTNGGIIKLYSSWPLTGASEQIGGDSAESVRFALDVYGNAAGGFALAYEALDDGVAANNGAWDAAQEAENATMVVNDLDAMVYIATYNSGAAAVAIPILNQAEPGPMAMISPANTAVGLTRADATTGEGEPDIYYPTGIRNYMRVVPADDIQGAAAANYAINELGATRAYVLHDNQIYGEGVAAVFRQTFEALGGEILGFEAFNPDAPDYQAVMTSIADTNPDIVYLGAIVNLNASKLLQDMRSLMPADQVAFMGPDGLINQAFVDGAGEAAEGAYITFGGLPPTALEAAGAEWYEGMLARLGRDPDAYSAYAFEAAVVAIQGIDKAGVKDRVAILNAMLTTEGFRGLLGTWSFAESGDRDSYTISMNVVTDGAIVFETDIAPPA
ncbi:MAG: branched-chain amino acid ABC transporter substrate-binding protein [Thermomicrobiales bacterium]